MGIRNTVIVGMGALGLLYGSYILDREGPEGICYVMDPDRIQKYCGRSFHVNGHPYRMPLCASDEAQTADLVIVAVKYNGLPSALETIRKCVDSHTIILSVLNGITSEEIIRRAFPEACVIDTVAQGMDAMKFGDELTYTRMGELRIGVRDERQWEALVEVARYFEKIGLPFTLDDDILHRMWGKFMLNVGVNQTCMVYETNYGGCLRPGEANRTMISAMREVIALARAEGIELGEDDLNEYVDILRTLSPEGMPSMRQDGVARRPSEVEMFAGTVLEKANNLGILVPVNQFLYERVREMEADYSAEL